MTERQRTGRPESPAEGNDEPDSSTAPGDARELADRLMASAERSLRDLGLTDANDFLNATRQTGGQ